MDDDRSDDRTYDFFKHLTTLNTAAILLALTLLEKFIEVTDAERAQLMFFEFGVSLLASLAMMIFYSFFRESYFSGRSMGCLPTCASLLAIGFFLRGVWDLVGVVMAGFPQVP